jgi:anti-sigma B factor antagonist
MSNPAPAASARARPVVVPLPPEIDISNAEAVEAQLRDAWAPGVTLIADMSATTFCDSSGARALLAAHDRAEAGTAEFRAAIPSPAVRRMLALLAFDTILRVHPSVAVALAAEEAGDARQSPAGAA